MTTPLFSKEQVEFLATALGLKIADLPETLPVRDGCVGKDTQVYWRAKSGPELVRAGDPSHWENIRNFPKAYQLASPRTETAYLD